MKRAASIAAIAISACAPLEQRPPEQRTMTVEVKVPVIVPCFTAAERPLPPTPTPIDIDNATTDQLAAAVAADSIADELYRRAIEALIIRCQAAAEKGNP